MDLRNEDHWRLMNMRYGNRAVYVYGIERLTSGIVHAVSVTGLSIMVVYLVYP